MSDQHARRPAVDGPPVTLDAAELGRTWPLGAASAWLHKENKALALRLADEIGRLGRPFRDAEMEAWLTSPSIACAVASGGVVATTDAAPIDLLVLGHDAVVLDAFERRLRLADAYRADHEDRRRQVFQNLVVLLLDTMVKAAGPGPLATFSETLQVELQVVEHTCEQLVRQCDAYARKLTDALTADEADDASPKSPVVVR